MQLHNAQALICSDFHFELAKNKSSGADRGANASANAANASANAADLHADRFAHRDSDAESDAVPNAADPDPDTAAHSGPDPSHQNFAELLAHLAN